MCKFFIVPSPFFNCLIYALHRFITHTPHITEALPTAFTPKGDGVNDTFEIRRFVRTDVTVDSFVIKIYNRYAELVFESSSLLKNRDGNNKKGKNYLKMFMRIPSTSELVFLTNKSIKEQNC